MPKAVQSLSTPLRVPQSPNVSTCRTILGAAPAAPSRRGILGAFAALGAAGASALDTTRAAGPSPDADLIRLCGAHPALIAAFNTSDGDGSDSDPAWAAYAASRDAISGACPVTLEGMRAKALAAKAEALSLDGYEQPSGTMAQPWSWDLVNDLLRLTGGVA